MKDKNEILTKQSPFIIYGKNISKSQSFKETEIFNSTEKSMFSMWPR